MHLPSHLLTMTVLMTPDMASFSGNVHGGTVLKLLDQAAYACASHNAGTSSMEVGVKVIAENIRKQLRAELEQREAALLKAMPSSSPDRDA